MRYQFRLVALLLLCAARVLSAGENFESVYISELRADNPRGLRDEDGERSGWVELYNGGISPINLNGWFLSDNSTNLTKWRFPGVILLPDKYLMVFASAKNRTNDLVHLHSNFRLYKEKPYVALVSPKTNLVSELSCQSGLGSYGRVRGEPSIAARMPRTTPGRANPSSGRGFAPEVVFSRAGGTFIEPFALQLSSHATGAVIRYTLDGSMPTSRSASYGAPLQITNTSYVRARCYQEGVLPGPPQSEDYLQLGKGAREFTSSLPLLIMDTSRYANFGKFVATSQGAFVQMSLIEPVQGKTSLTNRPVLTTRAGFRVRGSTSSGFPQSPFAVKFLDEFNEERHLSPFGLPADSDWVLYGPNRYDLVMIHNPFVYQLSRDMGRYSPRTRFVEVFILEKAGPLTKAHYHGVYVLTEKVSTGEQRVNIDRLAAEDLKPPNVTGGYLLKFDRLGPGESGVFSAGDRGMIFVEPREQTISLPQRAPQRQYIEGFLRDFDRALNAPNWLDPALGYRAFLDVDAAIDFHVLEVLSGNVDAMVLSTYFHKPRNGKITCGPHWDFDRALGSTDGRDDNPRQWSTGPFFGGAWWPRLFSDVDFWQRWVDRWQELRRNHFALTNLDRLIDQLCDEVREAQPREYERWDLQPRGGSYQGEINVMKTWLSNRVEFIDEQLVQPPRFNDKLRITNYQLPFILTNGSPLLVKLSAPTNVTIYYTLNGSDPRLPQGAISSNARAYSGPISVQTNLQIIARARDTNQRQTGGPPVSTPWSGPVSAKFVLSQK